MFELDVKSMRLIAAALAPRARESKSYSQLVEARSKLYRRRFVKVETHFATFFKPRRFEHVCDAQTRNV